MSSDVLTPEATPVEGPAIRRTPWRLAASAATWAFLAAMMAVLAATVVVPRLAGATPYTVLTGSMRPTAPPGTLVVVKPVDADDIRVGDVITYQLASGERPTVTHRVVGTAGLTADGERRWITQGDANPAADPAPVREVQVKGKVWYAVPYVGWANTWLTGEKRAWLVYAAAGGLLLYAGVLFAGSFRKAESR